MEVVAVEMVSVRLVLEVQVSDEGGELARTTTDGGGGKAPAKSTNRTLKIKKNTKSPVTEKEFQ